MINSNENSSVGVITDETINHSIKEKISKSSVVSDNETIDSIKETKNSDHGVEIVTEDIINTNLEKKKPKKYNGFLRNNNKKHKVKKENHLHKKEELPNEILKNDITSEVEEKNTKPVEKLSQEEYLLFYILRQKSGYKEENFWNTLDKVLKNKNFLDIKNNNLNLIEYSVLYESRDIFNKLIENFGYNLQQNQIESIFNFSLTKNYQILNQLFNYYDHRFQKNNDFYNMIVNKSSLFSYREDNNKVIVQWLVKNNNDLIDFTHSIFKNNNVSLLFTALQNEKFFKFLKNNNEVFKNSINSHFRSYSINKILNNDFVKNSNSIKIEHSEIVMNSWSSSTDDKIKSLSKENNDKIEVIVKKKKMT